MKLFTALAAAALTFTAGPAIAADAYVMTSAITAGGQTCVTTTTMRGMGTWELTSESTQTCEPTTNINADAAATAASWGTF